MEVIRRLKVRALFECCVLSRVYAYEEFGVRKPCEYGERNVNNAKFGVDYANVL